MNLKSLEEIVSQSRIKKGLYWEKALSLVEGCSPVSRGCLNCWAFQQTRMRACQSNQKMKNRYEGLCGENHFNGHIRLFENSLETTLKTEKPTLFSIWNDLFYEKVPDEFIYKTLNCFKQAYWHYFIILTKRPERMREYLLKFKYVNGKSWKQYPANNIIIGTTVEESNTKKRIEILLSIPAKIKMVSIEPLLQNLILFEPSILLKLKNIDWIIIGCETGKNPRGCKVDWMRAIIQNAGSAKIFIKAINNNGKIIKNIDDFPPDLRYREFPSNSIF